MHPIHDGLRPGRPDRASRRTGDSLLLGGSMRGVQLVEATMLEALCLLFSWWDEDLDGPIQHQLLSNLWNWVVLRTSTQHVRGPNSPGACAAAMLMRLLGRMSHHR